MNPREEGRTSMPSSGIRPVDRRKSRLLPGAILAAGLTLGLNGALQAGIGLMSRFADVVLENMKPGVYNLRALKNLPYVVSNPGDLKVDVLIEVLQPTKTMEGYEAIPDPGWLQILPNRFTIEPRQNHFSDIVLSIPEDPAYVGRHFQATIWAHTVDTGMTGAGVNSRFRFSVGTLGPVSLVKEKKRKAMMTLDFDLKPESVSVYDVPLGRAVNLKEERRSSLKLTNRADDPLKVKLVSVAWAGELVMPSGYEAAPDPAWLTFKPVVATVKSLTIAEFLPVLKVPDDPSFLGKKYAFLVKAEVISKESVPVEVYSKILVNVQAK
jgi:hypothetical protein